MMSQTRFGGALRRHAAQRKGFNEGGLGGGPDDPNNPSPGNPGAESDAGVAGEFGGAAPGAYGGAGGLGADIDDVIGGLISAGVNPFGGVYGSGYGVGIGPIGIQGATVAGDIAGRAARAAGMDVSTPTGFVGDDTGISNDPANFGGGAQGNDVGPGSEPRLSPGVLKRLGEANIVNTYRAASDYANRYDDLRGMKGQDALEHYLNYGAKEGRVFGQNADVDRWKAQYLEQNKDVAESGMDALEHYEQFGRKEGRVWGAPTRSDGAMTRVMAAQGGRLPLKVGGNSGGTGGGPGGDDGFGGGFGDTSTDAQGAVGPDEAGAGNVDIGGAFGGGLSEEEIRALINQILGSGAVPGTPTAQTAQLNTVYGLNPTALTAEEAYLKNNPDVAAAIDAGQFKDAREHYDLFGSGESRAWGAEEAGDPYTYVESFNNRVPTMAEIAQQNLPPPNAASAGFGGGALNDLISKGAATMGYKMRRGGRIGALRRARNAYSVGGQPDPGVDPPVQPGMVSAPGDGMSDSRQNVSLSREEYVVPSDVVSDLGNGSSEAGGRVLDNMVMGTRQQGIMRRMQMPPPHGSAYA